MRSLRFCASLSTVILSATLLVQAALLTPRGDNQGHETIQPRSSCSGYYNFSIDLVNVVEQRSASHDTIYISACVAVGNQDYCFTKSYGEHGKGTFNPNILFKNIPVGDNEVSVFSYLIINDDHGSSLDIETNLGNATLSLAQQGITFANLNNNTSVDEILAQYIGNTFARIVGFVLNVIGGLVELLSSGCDGWLAAGIHGFRGEDICNSSMVDLQGTDSSPGAKDQELFGFIPGVVCNSNPSQYNVSWSASMSDGTGNRTLPGTVFSIPTMSQQGLSASKKIALGVGIGAGAIVLILVPWLVKYCLRQRSPKPSRPKSMKTWRPVATEDVFRFF
jgi:hypothetical protein